MSGAPPVGGPGRKELVGGWARETRAILKSNDEPPPRAATPVPFLGDVGRCGLVPFERGCLVRRHTDGTCKGGPATARQRLPCLSPGDVGRWRLTSPFRRGISGAAPCCPTSVLGSGSLCFLPARAWLSRAPRLRVERATSGTHRAGWSRGTDEHARALLPCAGVSSGFECQPLRGPRSITNKQTNK